MRLEDTSQIAETVTRLFMSSSVARENSGIIWDKYETGWDYSVPLRKSLE